MKKICPGRAPFVLLFCLSLIIILPRPAVAVGPTDQIRESVNQVIDILKDKTLKKNEKLRREKIRNTVDKIFDWEEMAKRSLATFWRKRTPQEKKDFTSLFADMIEDNYVTKIERYENEKVVYTDERIEGDYAMVKTNIITQKGTEVPVNYRLLKENGQWKVYDVVIEGVSLINNYRTQFNDIIRSGSYEDLISRMKKKVLKQP